MDSVVAWDVALARFRDGLTEPPRLAGGADRREALVQSFVAAVERRDSLALRKLMITRAEFAYHYYPTAPEAHAPYDLTPALLWFMLEQGSLKGIRRVQQDLGGTPLGYAGHRCDAPPSHQGDNRVWGPCVILRVHSAGDTVAQRLFGSILERNGRFKFISYSNDR
ncbi:MAG TPA: hypothetical protein VD793_08305 [Gemmatimonadales bacterium]|nr:hypothetical protein [Gemmatimonadales bacterium]